MRGVYTAAGKISALNAARTLAYLTAPAGKAVEIIGITVTDESNATNFQFEAAIARITTLGSPANYTALAPTPHEVGDQAAGTTVNLATGTSTEPTTYGATINQEGAASVLGYRHEPQPEERIIVANSASIGIRMITTPTAFDADVRITFREIG
jgi:hypothetical protein